MDQTQEIVNNPTVGNVALLVGIACSIISSLCVYYVGLERCCKCCKKRRCRCIVQCCESIPDPDLENETARLQVPSTPNPEPQVSTSIPVMDFMTRPSRTAF